MAMEQFRGRPLVVNFWARWCGPCRDEIPELVRLRAEQGADGIEVIGVAIEENDKLEAVKDFAKAYDMRYPVVIAAKDGIPLMKALGNPQAGMPFTVYIGLDGKELGSKLGLVRRADLLIGTVLIPGAAAPKLVTREMVKTMKQGSVIVDVAIDQGGCVETSHATTHEHPTYVVDGVVHYCVANMPGAVARTSTFALNNVTLPFTLALADKGWKQALIQDAHLREGLNVCEGKVTCEPVAEAHGLPYVSAESVLGI